MPELAELLGEGNESGSNAILEELRLNEDAALVILFTTTAEDGSLHWEPDPAVNRYVVCPGDGCPACYVGSVPKTFALLPVYSIENRAVAVLRISKRRGAHALASCVVPFLSDPAIGDKLLVIRRNQQKYHVEAKPLPRNANKGVQAVKRFLAARETGLKLTSAFEQMSVEEYAQVARIRHLSSSLGGLGLDENDDPADASLEEPE